MLIIVFYLLISEKYFYKTIANQKILMKNKISFVLAISLFSVIISYSQNFPGGVTGAEVWYKPDSSGNFSDYSGNFHELIPCGNTLTDSLFNFNPSLYNDTELCLSYIDEIDGDNNYSVFMVSEPDDKAEPAAQVRVQFNDHTQQLFQQLDITDSLSRSGFVFHNQKGYASQILEDFSTYKNTHVHYYTLSNYDIDKIFKHFGEVGESRFLIGNYKAYPEIEDARDFAGLLPEYISFDRSLSKDELNRVNSYLCLKYGISQWQSDSYVNSKHMVYWSSENNNLFDNDKFGIGRDDISDLHQVQCESAHNRDYLVAATHDVKSTNAEVLGDYGGIENNNFLVFGDTGGSGLVGLENSLERLGRVWLAEVTGDRIKETPIAFRLSLNNEFDSALPDINSGDLTVWMLHDPYANRSKVSDFDNGNVEYYKPFNLDLTSGAAYAHYNEVLFDQDYSGYDQYTFAIGPDIIIQVKYVQWQCEGECFQMEVEVIGKAPEDIVHLLDEEGDPVDEFSFIPELSTEDKSVYSTYLCGNAKYTVEVVNDQGIQATYDFLIEEKNNTLDLGPDQNLSAANTIISLDAGVGLDTPEHATYEWYFNDQPINFSGSELEADIPGSYCVTITTADLSCRLSDCIEITNDLTGNIYSQYLCDENANEITVNIENGTPPYTTNISGSGFNLNHFHTTNNTQIQGVPAGNYLVTVTDNYGSVYTQNIQINNSGMTSGSLGPSQTLTLAQPQITLDGTQVFGNSINYSYQWYLNGSLLSYTNPQIDIDVPGEYKVLITDLTSNCQGEATIQIHYDFEGDIKQFGDCDEYSNTLEIYIDYGPLPPYTTTLTEASGQSYSYVHNGDFTVSGIPYGSYNVEIVDAQGNSFVQNDIVFWGLEMDIHQQLYSEFDSQGKADALDYEVCNYPTLTIDYSIPFTLDASSLVSGSSGSFTYEWFADGISLGYYNPILTYIPNYYCTLGMWGSNLNEPCIDQYGYEYILHTVVLTDEHTGCSISQSFYAIPTWWCPDVGASAAASLPSSETTEWISLITKVYPNPSNVSSTFNYEVSSEESFDGWVEVISMTGAIITRKEVQGSDHYNLPFSLMASGVYFIRITTPNEIKIDRVIIE